MKRIMKTALALLVVGSVATGGLATASSDLIPTGGVPDVVCSPPINHPLLATFDGSSANWLTGVVEDTDAQIHWNPYANPANLSFFWPTSGGGSGVAAGTVYSVLGVGDVVASSSTFTAGTSTAATATWRAGADGYMGFRFTCPAGVCYGYAHLTTTAPTGFPATLVDYCYNSAGAAITIAGGTAPVDPAIDVTPASLSASQATNATTTQTLTIANTGGSDLDWTITEATPRVTGPTGRLSPRTTRAPSARDYGLFPMAEVIVEGGFESGGAAWDESSTTFGTVMCTVADCGLGGGAGPHSGSWWAWFGGITSAETGYARQSVTLPVGTATLSFWLQVPSSSGLATDFLKVSIDGTELFNVTATTASAYANYTQVTLDVSAFADGGSHTLSFDSTVGAGSVETNFFVDDVSLDSQGGTPVGGCANPADLPWVSVSQGSGTTAGGDESSVTVTFDSNGLAVGSYSGLLCIASNDPVNPAVEVPVALTVTGGGTDPNVVCSATIDHTIAATLDGTSVNWINGTFVDADIPGSHFNPYSGSGNLLFYWGGAGSPNNGGVAATATGPYQVLATGAVIGPSSTFSQSANGANNETAAFLAGVDGYLGFRFQNEVTSQVNYGYVRLQTTAPAGFPAKIVDYCYNNAGAAITIAGGTPVTTPSVSKAFAPATVLVNVNSTATVTLTNPTASAATLSAALVDTLPSGLVASAASTTCTGGTASFTAGTLTLSSGASIPANGSCTLTGTVSSAAEGSYVNTIAAGALQTSAGNNATAASATLTVNPTGGAFPAPYCPVAFSNAVEPITRVLVTGIDNVSSATVNGSPALENFLSVAGGSFVAGMSYPIAVEGNTDGNFTTKIVAFIDWDQSGTFEASERFVLTDLINSTGTDGKQSTGSIVVPVTAAGGATRMRVIKRFNEAATACNTAGYGQAEDYTVTVTAETGTPIANVSPAAGFDFTVDEGTTGTDTLVIGNTGTATLTYDIQRALADRHNAMLSKWDAERRENDALKASLGMGPLSLDRSTAMRSGAVGRPLELSAEDISQMVSNTPEELNGVSCGSAAAGASDNSWWRRFYFNEHSISGAATINSVTVASETGVSTPVTVRVYSIPHSVTVDTIPTAQLTLLGSGTGTVGGDLTTTTVAISGGATVADTVGNDLVVEYHIDAGAGLPRFFPGGNPSAQTHKSFLSSTTCSIAEPVTTDSIGFPDFHIIMVVNVDTGPAGTGCAAPSNVPWLSVTPATGTVSPSASTNVAVTVNAGTLGAGTYDGLLCVNTNDPVSPQIEVPVSMTVQGNDTIFKDGFDSAAVFTQPVQDPSFEATTGDGGSNPFWTGNDSNDPGGTPFYSASGFEIPTHTGDWEIWFGGWRATASTQDASQSVTISSGGPRYLKYWRLVDVAPAGTATLKVYVDGTVVETTNVVANGVDANWVGKSVDVSSFADNASHTIKLEYVVAGSDDGNVFIDDVVIEATP